MTTQTWTKEEIKERMRVSDQWLIRGLLAIYKYQTEAEQSDDATLEDNGVGFNGVDAFILSQFARQFQTRGFLSPKQILVARKKMLKYAGQLATIANGKIQQCEAA